MCGIAGVMLKKGDNAGEYIVDMLKLIEHRGPDSTGIALFDVNGEDLKMTIGCPDSKRLDKMLTAFDKESIQYEDVLHLPNFYKFLAHIKTDDEYERALKIIINTPEVALYSCGRKMTVIKDTYLPQELDELYDIKSMKSHYAIGHVRLATESRVNVFWSHPFQSLAMPDLSIVHNGQITNFFTKRRQLEKMGYKFQTDNDSEVIAQEIAYYMLEEHFSFEDALRTVADGLDGAFSFLVATSNAIGVAKDRLATKPLMVAENDQAIAMASEEIAIEAVLGPQVSSQELPPGEVHIWQV